MDGGEPNGVVAIFSSPSAAQAALAALRAKNVDMRTVSLLGKGAGTPSDAPAELDEKGAHAKDIAGYWAEWGAIAGAGAGAAVVAVPLLAAVVGLGPFALALAAIPLASSAVGALGSALVGLGIHEAHAHAYEKALRDGKIVIVVHTDVLATLEDARDVLSVGAESVQTHGLRELRRA